MNDEAAFSGSIISPAHLTHWKGEYERLEKLIDHRKEEIKELEHKRAKLRKLIEAATDLCRDETKLPDKPREHVADPTFPALALPPVLAEMPPAKETGRESWKATVRRIVYAADDGIDTAALKAEMVRSSHHSKVLVKSESAFYHAISLLVSSGELIRRNGILFSPQSYKKNEQAIENGTLSAIKTARTTNSKSPMGDKIVEFMKTRPKGATTEEIAEHLKAVADFRHYFESGSSHFYNVISRLYKDKGILSREGKHYRLAKSESVA